MQQYPLLATKLYIPPTRREMVSRPRLIQSLNAGLGQSSSFARKLTLVSAPAGFGKTTLVREWVAHLRLGAARANQIVNRIAWLSLDESDSDPTRFLVYLIAALQTTDARQEPVGNIGKGALSMLQSPQPPPTEAVLTSLINEIAAIPDRIVLVLDDYHLIEAQPIHDTLTFLLEHLPPQMHLVIATREDPPLPLARLRARGQLTELRATDLRFSSSEAAEFFGQVMGLDLSAEDIAALETRTEGWIAGLQLAAISMQGHEDASSLIKSFTGSHRFVLDYLVEEVLHQQSGSVQTFLLQTAILDRLTGSLCDSLTGQDNGQATLEMLERSNLFIIPLDEERRWYRYHHLFGDLLRRRLHRTQPEQVSALHCRASAWFEQNGLADGAIEYALRVRHWLSRLPGALLLSRPQLCIFPAWYLFSTGQQDAAEICLRAVEQMLDAGVGRAANSEHLATASQALLSGPDRTTLGGRLAAIRALIGSWGGEAEEIIRHARQALESLPERDPWRGPAALALGDAYEFSDDLAAAYQARLEAAAACMAAGDITFLMLANLKLASTLRLQGWLQRTAEICRQQMQLADENGLSQSVVVGWSLAIWGEVLAELNDLDGALDRATQGVERTAGGDLALLGHSNMCLTKVLYSRGDIAGAEKIIQKMESLDRQHDLPPHITSQIAAWRVSLWLGQGKLKPAIQWAQDRGLDAEGGPTPSHETETVVLARVLFAQGRSGDTIRLLQGPLQAAEAGGRTSTVIEILVFQALAYQAGGDTDQAIATLERALILAEPRGFIRTFVNEGPPMARLLYGAVVRGIAPEYARRLLSAFAVAEPEQAEPPPTQASTSSTEFVEPLSERELEVLQLIAEGLTNPEIASDLYLALNTVKAHTRNIYAKLGAHSRTRAVARARALGVLPST